uniref:Uncharacterized protein n=1 Tax=Vespula pensylvanica TaxID=30213 RepID=A0A834P4G9_VESPE|nr:hypothetical protein H0235_007323 [Vespula pensylvanica]
MTRNSLKEKKENLAKILDGEGFMRVEAALAWWLCSAWQGVSRIVANYTGQSTIDDDDREKDTSNGDNNETHGSLFSTEVDKELPPPHTSKSVFTEEREKKGRAANQNTSLFRLWSVLGALATRRTNAAKVTVESISSLPVHCE